MQFCFQFLVIKYHSKRIKTVKLLSKKYFLSYIEFTLCLDSFWAKTTKSMTNLWEISDFPDFSPTSGSCNFFSTEAILKISDFSERSMSESFISAILVVWSNIWIPTHAFEKVKFRENAIHSPTKGFCRRFNCPGLSKAILIP